MNNRITLTTNRNTKTLKHTSCEFIIGNPNYVLLSNIPIYILFAYFVFTSLLYKIYIYLYLCFLSIINPIFFPIANIRS